jgi:predicted RNase H-like HicB family nuclease
MDDELERYLNRSYPYAVSVERTVERPDRYAAYFLDMPGCIAEGDTVEEAIENLRALKRPYLEKLIKAGRTPPQPSKLPGILAGPFGWYDEKTGMLVPASYSALDAGRADDVQMEELTRVA